MTAPLDTSSHATTAPSTATSGLMLAIIGVILRVGVGVVLVTAGIGKLANATAATVATQAALGVNGTVAAILATAISVAEVLLGVHLIIGLNLRWVAPITILLCGALLAVVIRLWVQGYTGGCGCFGIFGGGSPGLDETIRDGALVVAALGAWATHRFGPALDRRFSH